MHQHLAFTVAVALLLATTSTFAVDPIIPISTCPPASEISGCKCYQTMSTIICKEPVKKAFNLQHAYKLDALIIRDTTGLANLKDHDTNDFYLHVNQLTVIQNGATVEEYTVENLAEIFRLSTTTIKVETVGQSVLGLDLTDLRGMETVILTNLTLSDGLDLDIFSNEPNLKHLTLRNVAFQSTRDKFISFKSNLRTLEITHASGLKVPVMFAPSKCYPDVRTIIRIRNNPSVKSFIFDELFPDGQKDKCHYHIDLSENGELDENILTSQSKTLLDAPVGSLYLIMRGVNAGAGINCNCELRQAMQKHVHYFHGIYCKISPDEAKDGAKKAGFLDELAKADFKTPCTDYVPPTPPKKLTVL